MRFTLEYVGWLVDGLEQERFPVIPGGGHGIAAGSIAAVYKKHGGNIGMIWTDAHGGWNNQEPTCTGNIHGMLFSAVCGYGPDCMVEKVLFLVHRLHCGE